MFKDFFVTRAPNYCGRVHAGDSRERARYHQRYSRRTEDEATSGGGRLKGSEELLPNATKERRGGPSKLLRELVDLAGIEPATSSMPWKRAPSCATGPL